MAILKSDVGDIYIPHLRAYKKTDAECKEPFLQPTESYCVWIFTFLYNHGESFLKEIKGECRSSLRDNAFVFSAWVCFLFSHEGNKHTFLKLSLGRMFKISFLKTQKKSMWSLSKHSLSFNLNVGSCIHLEITL